MNSSSDWLKLCVTMSLFKVNTIIQKSLQEMHFKNCQIDFAEGQEIIAGHLSDITFLDVNCETQTDRKTVLHLALKSSKENEFTRDLLNLSNIFKQEILFYETVFPSFLEFQVHRGIKTIFNPLAKIYKCVVKKNIDLIMLENLKTSGYEVCDKRQPLSSQHLKLALVDYGKLHALSFAMRDQKPDLYQHITKDLKSVLKAHTLNVLSPFLPTLFNQVLDLLLKKQEFDVHSKLKHLLDHKKIIEQALQLYDENTTYSVVNHCDPWINNLMFQYEVRSNNIELNGSGKLVYSSLDPSGNKLICLLVSSYILFSI